MYLRARSRDRSASASRRAGSSSSDRSARKTFWLYPLRDLMGFFFWTASYWGKEIVWRRERYKLSYGGKMVRVCGEGQPATSRSVAVDNLA